MPFDVLQRRMFKMESLEHPPLSVFIKEFSEPQSCGQVMNKWNPDRLPVSHSLSGWRFFYLSVVKHKMLI